MLIFNLQREHKSMKNPFFFLLISLIVKKTYPNSQSPMCITKLVMPPLAARTANKQQLSKLVFHIVSDPLFF